MIIDPRRNNGVDLGVVDYVYNGFGFGITATKVVVPIHKKGAIAYIGLDQGLSPKEKIRVGNLSLLYVIIGQAKKMLPRGGFLYRIKRVDGANITQLDIDNVIVGQVARITNRRSNKQRIQQLNEMLD